MSDLDLNVNNNTSVETSSVITDEIKIDNSIQSKAPPTEIKVHISDLNFTKKIGDGSFSEVWIGSLKPRMEKFNHVLYGNEYACKLINRRLLINNRQSKQFIAAVLREKVSLYACQSSNNFIIHLFATLKNETKIGFITELCINQDLREYLASTKSNCNSLEIQYYGACIISAMQYLHKHCIIHRDIKPENILLNKEFQPKLSDFGCVKLLPPMYGTCDVQSNAIQEDPDFVGTPEFMAPELITISKSVFAMSDHQDSDDEEEDEEQESEESVENTDIERYEDGRLKDRYYQCLDYWSIGCVLYQLCTGQLLFGVKGNEFQVFKKVKTMDFSLDGIINENNDELFVLLKDLCSELLIEEPMKRIGVIDKNSIREHSFFGGIVWDQLSSMISPTFQMKSLNN